MCCWKCSTWGQIIWFVISDYVILPRKLQSEGSQYVTALKCLNQTILFYLLPRKLYSPETEWRQTAKNARVEQSTKSNFIPMPLWFCFIQKILDFEVCYPLLDIGNGYCKGQLCGQVVTTGWNSTLNFPAHVPLLLQGHLLPLRISEFNTGVVRFVNSQLVSRFLPVQRLFPFCLQTAVRSLGVVVFFVVLCKKK